MGGDKGHNINEISSPGRPRPVGGEIHASSPPIGLNELSPYNIFVCAYSVNPMRHSPKGRERGKIFDSNLDRTYNDIP
jgi:hypothetical protein